MEKTNDTLCEHTKIRLIAAAIGHQQCTKTAANVIPIPGTERFIAIGTAAEVARLLEIAPLEVSGNSGELPAPAALTPQQINKLLFAADILEGVDCENTAGDLRDIARGAAC
jgi:hypothetical protein